MEQFDSSQLLRTFSENNSKYFLDISLINRISFIQKKIEMKNNVGLKQTLSLV